MWLDLHTSWLLDKWLDKIESRLRKPTNRLTTSNNLFLYPVGVAKISQFSSVPIKPSRQQITDRNTLVDLDRGS